MKKSLTFAVMLGLLFVAGVVQAQKVEEGKKIKMDYTLTIDGQTVETTEGRQPLEFEYGQGQIIPGLAKALEGMTAGQEKTITVDPKDAYGEVNQEAFKEFPKASFPEAYNPQPGMVMQLQNPNGVIPGIVWEVKDDVIVVNFNHPLAGKTLEFKVKVVSVE